MMFVLRSSRVRNPSPAKAAWLVGAALAAGAMMLAGAAQAAPLTAATSAAVAWESDVLQVRDGCGRGLRFSNRRNRCVPIEREFEGDRGFDRERDNDGGRRSRRRDGDGDSAAGAVAAGVVLGIIGATAIQNNRRGNRGNAIQGGNSGGTQSISGGSGKRKRN